MNARPTVSVLRPGTWSLTAKLSLASVALCVLCVAATSAVVGLKSSERAREAAGEIRDYGRAQPAPLSGR